MSEQEYAISRWPDADELIAVPCEIWIPAARPDVIHEENVDRLDTRIVLPGANIPITPGAEQILHDRGVLYLPDFIANAGGVICAAMEYHGSTQAAVFDEIQERIRGNTQHVLEASARDEVVPRRAAEQLSLDRIHAAMATRRFTIF